MRRSRPLHVLTLLALCGTSILAVEPPLAPPTPQPTSKATAKPASPVAPADRNAAIKYLTLAMDLPREASDKVNAVNYDACGITIESIKNDPAAAAALAAIESYDVTPWIKASTLAKYDLELATEDGFTLLLPHLGKMRSAARLLRWSARVSLAQGAPEQAAERLAAIVRMSRHVSHDRILISSLVGMAMSAVAFDEMRTLAGSGTLTEPARASLVGTLESLDTSDPFLMRGSLRGERELASQSILTRFTGPEAGATFVEVMLQASEQDDVSRVRAKVISEWDGERMASEARRLDAAYDAVEEAWDSPDPRASLERVEARINAEEFGTLAAVLAPATSRAFASHERAKKDLEATLTILREATVAAPSPR